MPQKYNKMILRPVDEMSGTVSKTGFEVLVLILIYFSVRFCFRKMRIE